jgi:Uma2 family endonuclease
VYERFGVTEYWIVDPDAGSIAVYRRHGQRFVRVDSADVVTTPLLPGLVLELRTIFASN